MIAETDEERPLTMRKMMKTLSLALSLTGAAATVPAAALAADYSLQQPTGPYVMMDRAGNHYGCFNAAGYSWCVPATRPQAGLYMTLVAQAVVSKRKINVGCLSSVYEGSRQCESFVIDGVTRWVPEFVTLTPVGF